MLRSKTIREGSLGLFILLGLLVFGGFIFWLKGGKFRDDTYQVIVEFENAEGLREGAKIRYRGIEVGKINAIIPSSNGIDIVFEISDNLKIPKNVQIETNLSGLLGESVVNIIPQQQLTAKAEAINPFSEKCQQANLILCNKERIKGENNADLINSLTRLSEVYSSPEFYNNINSAVSNAALAGKKVAILSDELSAFSKDLKKDINKFSQTAQAFTNTANTTSSQITRLGNEFSTTSQQINLLVTNLNTVINENRANFSVAIANVSDTTEQLSNLVGKLELTVTEANSKLAETDTKKIVKNLEEFSENLKEISETLNQPTNLVTLQQTLDAAKVTFENTAKITSDLDELTGDAEFRNNVKKLVDGLSNLVSYNENLQKQIELTKILESAQEIAVDETTEKAEVKSTSNLKKDEVKPTSNLKKDEVKPTSNLKKDEVKPTSNLKKSEKKVKN